MDAKPMQQDFARWYATLSIGDDADRRQARWQGVLNLLENADGGTLEALLRLAFRRAAAPPSVLQTIRQAFKDADETFEMSGNDRELQVLAGASIAAMMED